LHRLRKGRAQRVNIGLIFAAVQLNCRQLKLFCPGGDRLDGRVTEDANVAQRSGLNNLFRLGIVDGARRGGTKISPP
jgi:hypothetical protein